MAWEITYNGFGSADGDWAQIQITEYRAEPVLAGDGQTVETLRHVMVGTAMITASSAANFEVELYNARSVLSRQGGHLVVNQTGGVFPGTDPFVNVGAANEIQSDNMQGTPRCEFSITRIFGSLSAIVGFTFTWHEYLLLQGEDGDDFHVLSHWWTQEFETDEGGLQQWTVAGALRVKADAPAAPDGSGVTYGPNPDRYRRLVVPLLPEGFRVINDRWGTTPDGQGLVYSLVALGYARTLPWPAKRGTGSFTWQRSLDSAHGAVGLKIFEAEIEGDGNALRTELLASMVRCAQHRIAFAPTPLFGQNQVAADTILSCEVRELDIFNRNRIGLTIVALGTGSEPANMLKTTNLLKDLNEANPAAGNPGNQPYQPPDAYGDRLIRSVRRQLFEPAVVYTPTSFPKAETEAAIPAEQIFVVPPARFEEVMELVEKGQQADSIQTGHVEFPYLQVRAVERVMSDTGTIALRAHGPGADRVYQAGGAVPLVMTEMVLSRLGKAPARVMLKKPPGSILRREEWDVVAGPLDANNNRHFIGHYVRVVEILDVGQAGWDNEVVTPGGAAGGDEEAVTLRRFRPPNGLISFPHDPVTENSFSAGNRTIFDQFLAEGGFEFNFQFAPETYFRPGE